MKKVLILILIISSSISTYAQWDLNVSMGLDFKAMPSFRDYVNANFATGGNQISTFKSAISFNGEADYKIQNNFELGIEYNIQVDSYNSSFGTGGTYEISYNLHRPSLVAYYVIPGESYQFKFGGGVGYRYLSLNERIYSGNNFTAAGFGFLARAVGNTKLGENFYALLGAELRYDFLGEVSNGNQKLYNPTMNENLNMNSISFGIFLGITYTL